MIDRIQRALALGSPKPWRVDPQHPRMVLDANGDNTCTTLLPEDAETIVLLVNGVSDLLNVLSKLQANSDPSGLSNVTYCGNRDRPYPR
jgi:hypothetical protein